jgi:CRP-like cAMP-binding protein
MELSNSKTSFIDYLRQFIDSESNDFEDDIQNTKESFTVLNLKKNDYLVKEGEVCKYFCYIESGILQHSIFILDEEKTSYLALRNTVTTSLNSFLFNKPSRKSIKAIFDCELWIIDIDIFRDLIKNNKVFNQFYYNLIEKQICLIDDYRIDLLTLTPEERYKKLLATETKLLQEVPLHYLASFLGISSRHMSRIRKNIL